MNEEGAEELIKVYYDSKSNRNTKNFDEFFSTTAFKNDERIYD
jgi:hypothetical protein